MTYGYNIFRGTIHNDPDIYTYPVYGIGVFK